MSESKHTPGPWNIGQPGGPSGLFWSLVNPDGNVVAMQITSEANAKLIAEAPKLFVALKTIRDAFWTDGEDLEDRIDDLKEIAKQAIAKVEEIK